MSFRASALWEIDFSVRAITRRQLQATKPHPHQHLKPQRVATKKPLRRGRAHQQPDFKALHYMFMCYCAAFSSLIGYVIALSLSSMY